LQEIGNLYNDLFDWGSFYEAETRYFVHEFETRHGNEDLKALSKCESLLMQLKTRLTDCKVDLDAHNDSVSLSVGKAITLASNQLTKEKSFEVRPLF
jgi:hypothetical protein